MPRFEDRRPRTLFSGAELPRLMTMVVMLGVLGMLISRARDPSTWLIFSGGSAVEGESAGGAGAEETPRGGELAKKPPADAQAGEPPSHVEQAAQKNQPDDRDPAELKQARHEFQAVSDKARLSQPEMFSYWRLIRWVTSQSTAEMRARANKKVLFTELYEHPEEHRGELIALKLHIRRALTYPAHDDKTPGVERLYEAWGWTDESRSEYYVVVFPELPPGMPLGADLYEEATFVGYFFKLFPYESQEGKWRAEPLLVGHLIWNPTRPVQPAAATTDWTWWLALGGAVVVLLFVLRWTAAFFGRGKKTRQPLRSNPDLLGEEAVPIEEWLERAEEGQKSVEIQSAANHEANGASRGGDGASDLLSDRLDGGKDRDG